MKPQLLDVNVDVMKTGGGTPLISEKKFVSEAEEDQDAEVKVRGEVSVEVVLVLIVGFDGEEGLPVRGVLSLHGDVVLQVQDQGVHVIGGKVAGGVQLQEGVVDGGQLVVGADESLGVDFTGVDEVAHKFFGGLGSFGLVLMVCLKLRS